MAVLLATQVLTNHYFSFSDLEKSFMDLLKEVVISNESLKKMPPHRFLAIQRGDRLGIIKISIKTDLAKVSKEIESKILKNNFSPSLPFIKSVLNQTISKK